MFHHTHCLSCLRHKQRPDDQGCQENPQQQASQSEGGRDELQRDARVLAFHGLQASLGDLVSLKGDFAFAKIGGDVRGVARSTRAVWSTDGVEVGVTGGDVALILPKDGGVQLQASGVPVDGRSDVYAHDLYSNLRSLDKAGAALILVEDVPDRPEWVAVRDRLARSATPSVPR